jgi:hypothetical protein
MTRLAIRGFIGRVKVLEELADVDDEGDGMEALVEKHAIHLLTLPGGERHMIEIEFLDEPDPLQRFFRIGTDPDQMITPVAVRVS